MLKLVRNACAGTLESSDAYVEVELTAGENEIEIESAVKDQFGDAIYEAISEVIQKLDVQNVKLRIVDRGALDCVIRARVETALLRGTEEAE